MRRSSLRGTAVAILVLAVFASQAGAQHAGHHAHPSFSPTPTPSPAVTLPPGMPGMAPAPEVPSHAGMHGHEMGTMPGARMESRTGSGTSWHPQSTPMAMTDWQVGEWTLMAHGRAQVGYNHQGSLRGQDSWSMPNWGMLMAERPLGIGRLELTGMTSLEPLTFPPGGLPQLLQTGETYLNQPIVDRQHPHNLFMELSARYSVPLSPDASVFLYGGPVAEPALGPEAFMHRASAGENPWAPLVHHLTDSTHITNGVVTAGMALGGLKFDASLFNGREPGENRWIVTPGPLDSYSGRVTLNPTADWSLQVSAGHLTQPEALSNFDTLRTTASVGYNRAWDDGNWASTLLWGHNRELATAPEDRDGFLLETALDWTRLNHVYSRVEWVNKEGLVPGVEVLPVGAWTLGAVRDVWRTDRLALGVGADVTVDVVPQPLQAAYGGPAPVSFQVYLRLAPSWTRGMAALTR